MTVGELRPRRMAAGLAMGLKTWIDGVRGGVASFSRRIAGDVRGNVAMLFGLSLPVLLLMVFGGVDIHRMSTVRVNLQDALDAAALAAARSPYTTDADLKRVGLAALKANLQAYPHVALEENLTTFTLNDDDVVIADARVQVKTLVANIFLPPYGQLMDDYLPVGSHSEVDRSSRNIEVAMVLDVTGSMAGDRIEALIDAAKDLVDLVVQDVQTPYYSKVALVPYSNSVNPGSYLNTVRGSVATSFNMSNAVLNLSGTQRSISDVSDTRPAVVTTTANHGFENGDIVWITGVSGISSLNNKAYEVRNKGNRTFELYTVGGARVDGRNFNNYNGNGKVQKCQNNDCSITITANNHGLTNNRYVYLTDVNGMTGLNNKTFLVGNTTTNTFTIDPDDTSTLAPYTSGGKVWCAWAGCTWFTFENMYGDLQTNHITDCVTERTGTNRYTEVSASTSHVGRHYTPDASCLDDQILPLSSNKSTLKSRINGFEAIGGTAGQIGIGWGWYMLSPNFNAIWPSGSASAYDTSETLKAIVIMTDGEFNSPYCSGVISRDAGPSSGDNRYKIDCAPDNDDPFDQSEALCDGMKAQGIMIYTVGLGISSTGEAADLLRYCATGTSNFHMADDADDLAGAFAAIGRDITQLRISK